MNGFLLRWFVVLGCFEVSLDSFFVFSDLGCGKGLRIDYAPIRSLFLVSLATNPTFLQKISSNPRIFRQIKPQNPPHGPEEKFLPKALASRGASGECKRKGTVGS